MSKKGDRNHGLEHTVNTIGPVGRVRWRPGRSDYLASSALCIDFAVNVWDVKRPFVPFASFNQHRDVTTDIAWGSDPHTLISTSKDGTLYQHVFRDAVRPGDKANPVGLSFDIHGDITHAHRHFPRNNQSHGVMSKVRISAHHNNDLFRKQLTPTELFRLSHSKLAMYQHKPDSGLSTETVIKETAKQYQLLNMSLAEACDINSSVARRLGRDQVALTWTLLKTVHSVSTGDPGGVRPGDAEPGQHERLRTSSMGTQRNTRKLSSKQSVTIEQSNTSNTVNKETSESEEEGEQVDNINTVFRAIITISCLRSQACVRHSLTSPVVTQSPPSPETSSVTLSWRVLVWRVWSV